MKNRNKRGSIFTLLLSNYIIFTLLLILAFIGCTVLFFNNAMRSDSTDGIRRIINYDYLLQKGEYDNIPISKILGKNGAIVVMDNTYTIVYNPDALNISLNSDDMEFISDALGNYSISAEVVIASDNIENYKITYTYMNGDSHIDELYIFDNAYNQLYASGDRFPNHITDKQYRLAAGVYLENYFINRYSFLSSSETEYTLLLLSDKDEYFAEFKGIGDSLRVSALLFYTIYALSILCLILWLKQRINKPLSVLCDSFQKFESGTYQNIDYKGPREFVQLFSDFSAMAQRLKRSEIAQAKAEADKSKLIANIAHDLKTPISVIIGYSRALCDGVISEDKQDKYLEIIEKKAIRLNDLINEFYDYSKINHPDFTVKTTRSDICEVMRHYIANAYQEIESAGFCLDVRIPEEHIFCYVDTSQLTRAFDNILSNSLKYNPSGTRILLSLTLNTEMVNIIFADDGIGIPPEIMEDIFKPFVVGDTARGGYGSGLGLATAKGIIAAHRGNICLTDRVYGYKTAFEIVLPVANDNN